MTIAELSTGPKTDEGKARASQNARKHGLNLPVRLDYALSAKAARLAREIAGANAPSEVLECALRVAEADVDVVRIRQARYNLMVGEPIDPEYNELSSEIVEKKHRQLRKLMRKFGPFAPLFAEQQQELSVIPSDKKKPAPALTDIMTQYIVLSGYERRALSRRKFAIRDLDAARANSANGANHFGETNPN